MLFTQSTVCTCLEIRGPLNMLLAFSYTMLTFNLRSPLNNSAFTPQPSSGSTQSFPVSNWNTSFVREILTLQVWLDVFLDTMMYDNEYACMFSVFFYWKRLCPFAISIFWKLKAKWTLFSSPCIVWRVLQQYAHIRYIFSVYIHLHLGFFSSQVSCIVICSKT